MRYIRLFSALLLVLIAGGCERPTRPESLDAVAGSYLLEKFDNRDLPTHLPYGSSYYTPYMVGGTLELTKTGAYDLTTIAEHRRILDTSVRDTIYLRSSGTYGWDASGDLVFTPEDANYSSVPGWLESDGILIVRMPNFEPVSALTFRRGAVP